jgi:hypothetical protein
MAYTLEIADAVIRTVGKFRTLNAYQLAGHVANLDFWADEVRHALAVIDGYSRRDSVRKKSERTHIGSHMTRRFTAQEKSLYNEFEDAESLSSARPDDYRIDANEIKAKRQQVADALYRFLKRCHKEDLLSGVKAKECLTSCELAWEPGDFADNS